MANIGYSLDTVGNNPLNKVSETRTLNKKVLDGRAFVIPRAAPFFAESVVIYKNGIRLIPGHDYFLILKSEELSQTTERDIRGGILFNTVTLEETITFELQTVGGNFNVPIGNTIENMVRVIRNPIFTTWSQLTGTPIGLPTWDHNEDWGSSVGYASFIDSINRLQLSLLQTGGGSGGDGSALAALNNHINSPAGHTKNQVGLNNVQNYAIAQDADFNAPYANNKYTTPRSVMFAIDRFIGTTLETQRELIAGLEATVTENTTAYRGLMNQWNDLRQTLNSVQTNYESMTLAVNGYAQTLNRFESEYKAINDNQKAWLDKLAEFNATLIQYGKDYNSIIETRDILLASFAELKLAFETLNTSYKLLDDAILAMALRVAKLEQHGMYPEVKVITAGSFHFRIKPNQKYSITLIGAGGGHSELLNDSTLVPYYRGENGTSTSLWCLQNTETGENSPSSSPIAIAGGGFGAEASHGPSPTNIIKYGLGGRGGAFKTKTGLVIDEASNGEGGIKGYGDFKEGIISKQDTGYDHFGSKWGKGSNAEDALGQGGEGAIVRLQIGNTTNKELEFIVKVGEAGRSHNPEKSNATGGLAIINKIQ